MEAVAAALSVVVAGREEVVRREAAREAGAVAGAWRERAGVLAARLGEAGALLREADARLAASEAERQRVAARAVELQAALAGEMGAVAAEAAAHEALVHAVEGAERSAAEARTAAAGHEAAAARVQALYVGACDRLEWYQERAGVLLFFSLAAGVFDNVLSYLPPASIASLAATCVPMHARIAAAAAAAASAARGAAVARPSGGSGSDAASAAGTPEGALTAPAAVPAHSHAQAHHTHSAGGFSPEYSDVRSTISGSSGGAGGATRLPRHPRYPPRLGRAAPHPPPDYHLLSGAPPSAAAAAAASAAAAGHGRAAEGSRSGSTSSAGRDAAPLPHHGTSKPARGGILSSIFGGGGNGSGSGGGNGGGGGATGGSHGTPPRTAAVHGAHHSHSSSHLGDAGGEELPRGIGLDYRQASVLLARVRAAEGAAVAAQDAMSDMATKLEALETVRDFLRKRQAECEAAAEAAAAERDVAINQKNIDRVTLGYLVEQNTALERRLGEVARASEAAAGRAAEADRRSAELEAQVTSLETRLLAAALAPPPAAAPVPAPSPPASSAAAAAADDRAASLARQVHVLEEALRAAQAEVLEARAHGSSSGGSSGAAGGGGGRRTSLLVSHASVGGDGDHAGSSGGGGAGSTVAELAALSHDALVERVLALEAEREAADGVAMGKLRALAMEVRRLRAERDDAGGVSSRGVVTTAPAARPPLASATGGGRT